MTRSPIYLIALVLAALVFGAVVVEAQPRPSNFEAPPSPLSVALDEVLADEDFDDAFWGIHVVDLRTGATLYARNPVNNFIPASTLKLLTTAAALDALGPDYRYTTGLYLNGVVRNSTLEGHLVVRGSGDPTISDRLFAEGYPTDGDPLAVFRQWADSLAAHGVRAVKGHVIGDASFFEDEFLGAGWAWDDEPTPFAAQISALSFNEGRLSVSASGASLGRRAVVLVEPATDYVFVANRTTTVGRQAGGRHDLRREPGSNTIWLESDVPQGSTLRRTVSVHNPARYFVHVLRSTLREAAIDVDGDPVYGADWREPLHYGEMTRVATHTSLPLSELVALANKESQNLYAEHMLRTLGAERCAEARSRSRAPARLTCGSAAAGVLAAEDLFERAGMRTDRMRMRDGSGMSHYNMLSPVDLTALLRYMWEHPDPAVRDAFVTSLAVGGIDGTLQRRFTRGSARGRVNAKTGTVTGARNLSGYVTLADGTPVAFALLANQFGTSVARITRAQDAIVEALARQSL